MSFSVDADTDTGTDTIPLPFMLSVESDPFRFLVPTDLVAYVCSVSFLLPSLAAFSFPSSSYSSPPLAIDYYSDAPSFYSNPHNMWPTDIRCDL